MRVITTILFLACSLSSQGVYTRTSHFQDTFDDFNKWTVIVPGSSSANIVVAQVNGKDRSFAAEFTGGSFSSPIILSTTVNIPAGTHFLECNVSTLGGHVRIFVNGSERLSQRTRTSGMIMYYRKNLLLSGSTRFPGGATKLEIRAYTNGSSWHRVLLDNFSVCDPSEPRGYLTPQVKVIPLGSPLKGSIRFSRLDPSSNPAEVMAVVSLHPLGQLRSLPIPISGINGELWLDGPVLILPLSLSTPFPSTSGTMGLTIPPSTSFWGFTLWFQVFQNTTTAYLGAPQSITFYNGFVK